MDLSSSEYSSQICGSLSVEKLATEDIIFVACGSMGGDLPHGLNADSTALPRRRLWLRKTCWQASKGADVGFTIWCIVSVQHQNEGSIGKSIPDVREIFWDPRDFPNFGGARTFSHHQSFYRDQKIVPCGHDSVKINPSLLMMREWSTLIMYDHQHFIATIIVSYDQWSNWSLPTSGIRRNIILCQPAVKWFDLVLTVDSWKWFIGPRLVFQPSTTSRDALLCFKESREPELHSQPKHIGPALDHLRKWIMTMIMFLDFEYILTN